MKGCSLLVSVSKLWAAKPNLTCFMLPKVPFSPLFSHCMHSFTTNPIDKAVVLCYKIRVRLFTIRGDSNLDRNVLLLVK